MDVLVGHKGEVFECEQTVLISSSPDIQRGQHTSCRAVPNRSIAAITAVPDQLARCSPKVHLMLVQHPAHAARIGIPSSTNVDRGDDPGFAAVADALRLVNQPPAAVVPGADLR